MGTEVRIASWNLSQRTEQAAARLGQMLADHGGADLVLLQEASQGGMSRFCETAGLDWWVHLRDEFPDLLRARGRSGRPVAIVGRGDRIQGPTPFPDMPLPEKVLAGWIDLGGIRTTVVTYHAPTGVQHKLLKPIQAVRVAQWLASIDGPVILGGDFNTPLLDPPDFDRVRTHWHTGGANLGGALGDDLLVGPSPIHSLRDALRTYLGGHPSELEAIAEDRPEGPLAVSYRPRREGDEHRYRYDAVWLSGHFAVTNVQYFYDEAIEAGTDHALVLVDATIEIGAASD